MAGPEVRLLCRAFDVAPYVHVTNEGVYTVINESGFSLMQEKFLSNQVVERLAQNGS